MEHLLCIIITKVLSPLPAFIPIILLKCFEVGTVVTDGEIEGLRG